MYCIKAVAVLYHYSMQKEIHFRLTAVILENGSVSFDFSPLGDTSRRDVEEVLAEVWRISPRELVAGKDHSYSRLADGTLSGFREPLSR